MAENQDRSPRNDVGKATWLKIFKAFKLAIDVKKLVLAAMGILVTYLGWWILSQAFYSMRDIPEAKNYTSEEDLDRGVRWTLIHELAGNSQNHSATAAEWQKLLNDSPKLDSSIRGKIEQIIHSLKRDETGRLRGCPWDENRGPNQFLFASDLIQQGGTGGDHVYTRNAVKRYLLFMVEPLCKFLVPVTYFFDSRAGGFFGWNRLYLVLILLWTVATWGYFGGAISRIATVQLARNEKVGLRESLQFVSARWQGYVFAPILPLVALLFMGFGLWFIGLLIGWTFVLGDILGGLLWPLVMILGLVMAVVLVGLIGWPLMNATISTEGSDSFDALSRSYSYVFQVPWYYVGYSIAALLDGAVLVFFVGFMATLLVYFGRWGIYQAPVLESRDPAYLFQYAPASFGWRDVLLKDSPHAIPPNGAKHYTLQENKASWITSSSIGSYLVALWLGAFFLLVIGFGYSYFWTAATIIYLLLRQRVDDTDFDEVYLEEDLDQPFVPQAPAPAPAAAPAGSGPPGVTFTMVDAPALHQPPDNNSPGQESPKPAVPFGNSPPAS